MMGERRVMQEALFYGFSLERHVPDDHLLRRIDRFVWVDGELGRVTITRHARKKFDQGRNPWTPRGKEVKT
jgi:hypothetical protein